MSRHRQIRKISKFILVFRYKNILRMYLFIAQEPDRSMRLAIKRHSMLGGMFKRYSAQTYHLDEVGKDIQDEIKSAASKAKAAPTAEDIRATLADLKAEKRRIFALIATNTMKKKLQTDTEVAETDHEVAEKAAEKPVEAYKKPPMTFLQPRGPRPYTPRPYQPILNYNPHFFGRGRGRGLSHPYGYRGRGRGGWRG